MCRYSGNCRSIQRVRRLGPSRWASSGDCGESEICNPTRPTCQSARARRSDRCGHEAGSARRRPRKRPASDRSNSTSLNFPTLTPPIGLNFREFLQPHPQHLKLHAHGRQRLSSPNCRWQRIAPAAGITHGESRRLRRRRDSRPGRSCSARRAAACRSRRHRVPRPNRRAFGASSRRPQIVADKDTQ